MKKVDIWKCASYNQDTRKEIELLTVGKRIKRVSDR